MITVYKVENKPDAKIFRFPPWVGMILLYVSYCLVGVFELRSSLMGAPLGAAGLVSIFFDGAAMSQYVTGAVYLLAGLLGWVWFEVLSWFFTVFMRMRFPHFGATRMRHILRCFFVLRNLVLAGIYLAMFWKPLSIGLILYPVTFLVTTLACGGFYLYFTNRTLPRFLRGHALMMMSQIYFLYQLLEALALIFAGVTL